MDLTSSSSTAEIARFQQNLIDLGYPLRGGADGKLGPSTKGYAHDAAIRYSLPPPKGDVYPEALVEGIKKFVLDKISHRILLPPNFIDVTDDAVGEWREHKRPFSQITGVTLHQTGCPMPDISDTELSYFLRTQELSQAYTPSLCRWAKFHSDNDDYTGRKIYTSLRAHFGITYTGRILYIHPITYMGWHAQSLSHRTIGIEIAGFFRGVEKDPDTLPAGGFPRQVMTSAQIEAAKALIRYLHALVKQNGGSLTGIFPHRLASGSRRPDVCERGWKEIGLPMMSELHLTDGGPGFTMGSGLPIPFEWDPSRVGYSY